MDIQFETEMDMQTEAERLPHIQNIEQVGETYQVTVTNVDSCHKVANALMDSLEIHFNDREMPARVKHVGQVQRGVEQNT